MSNYEQFSKNEQIKQNNVNEKDVKRIKNIVLKKTYVIKRNKRSKKYKKIKEKFRKYFGDYCSISESEEEKQLLASVDPKGRKRKSTDFDVCVAKKMPCINTDETPVYKCNNNHVLNNNLYKDVKNVTSSGITQVKNISSVITENCISKNDTCTGSNKQFGSYMIDRSIEQNMNQKETYSCRDIAKKARIYSNAKRIDMENATVLNSQNNQELSDADSAISIDMDTEEHEDADLKLKVTTTYAQVITKPNFEEKHNIDANDLSLQTVNNLLLANNNNYYYNNIDATATIIDRVSVITHTSTEHSSKNRRGLVNETAIVPIINTPLRKRHMDVVKLSSSNAPDEDVDDTEIEIRIKSGLKTQTMKFFLKTSLSSIYIDTFETNSDLRKLFELFQMNLPISCKISTHGNTIKIKENNLLTPIRECNVNQNVVQDVKVTSSSQKVEYDCDRITEDDTNSPKHQHSEDEITSNKDNKETKYNYVQKNQYIQSLDQKTMQREEKNNVEPINLTVEKRSSKTFLDDMSKMNDKIQNSHVLPRIASSTDNISSASSVSLQPTSLCPFTNKNTSTMKSACFPSTSTSSSNDVSSNKSNEKSAELRHTLSVICSNLLHCRAIFHYLNQIAHNASKEYLQPVVERLDFTRRCLIQALEYFGQILHKNNYKFIIDYTVTVLNYYIIDLSANQPTSVQELTMYAPAHKSNYYTNNSNNTEHSKAIDNQSYLFSKKKTSNMQFSGNTSQYHIESCSQLSCTKVPMSGEEQHSSKNNNTMTCMPRSSISLTSQQQSVENKPNDPRIQYSYSADTTNINQQQSSINSVNYSRMAQSSFPVSGANRQYSKDMNNVSFMPQSTVSNGKQKYRLENHVDNPAYYKNMPSEGISNIRNEQSSHNVSNLLANTTTVPNIDTSTYAPDFTNKRNTNVSSITNDRCQFVMPNVMPTKTNNITMNSSTNQNNQMYFQTPVTTYSNISYCPSFTANPDTSLIVTQAHNINVITKQPTIVVQNSPINYIAEGNTVMQNTAARILPINPQMQIPIQQTQVLLQQRVAPIAGTFAMTNQFGPYLPNMSQGTALNTTTIAPQYISATTQTSAKYNTLQKSVVNTPVIINSSQKNITDSRLQQRYIQSNNPVNLPSEYVPIHSINHLNNALQQSKLKELIQRKIPQGRPCESNAMLSAGLQLDVRQNIVGTQKTSRNLHDKCETASKTLMSQKTNVPPMQNIALSNAIFGTFASSHQRETISNNFSLLNSFTPMEKTLLYDHLQKYLRMPVTHLKSSLSPQKLKIWESERNMLSSLSVSLKGHIIKIYNYVENMKQFLPTGEMRNNTPQQTSVIEKNDTSSLDNLAKNHVNSCNTTYKKPRKRKQSLNNIKSTDNLPKKVQKSKSTESAQTVLRNKTAEDNQKDQFLNKSQTNQIQNTTKINKIPESISENLHNKQIFTKNTSNSLENASIDKEKDGECIEISDIIEMNTNIQKYKDVKNLTTAQQNHIKNDDCISSLYNIKDKSERIYNEVSSQNLEHIMHHVDNNSAPALLSNTPLSPPVKKDCGYVEQPVILTDIYSKYEYSIVKHEVPINEQNNYSIEITDEMYETLNIGIQKPTEEEIEKLNTNSQQKQCNNKIGISSPQRRKFDMSQDMLTDMINKKSIEASRCDTAGETVESVTEMQDVTKFNEQLSLETIIAMQLDKNVSQDSLSTNQHILCEVNPTKQHENTENIRMEVDIETTKEQLKDMSESKDTKIQNSSFTFVDINDLSIKSENNVTIDDNDVTAGDNDVITGDFVKVENSDTIVPTIFNVKSISPSLFEKMDATTIILSKDDLETFTVKDESKSWNVNGDWEILNEIIKKPCLRCKRKSTVLCEKCLKAPYCSQHCLNLHWKGNHHMQCKSYTDSSIYYID